MGLMSVSDETHVAYWESGISTEILRTSATQIRGFVGAHRTLKLPNCVEPIVRSLEGCELSTFTDSLLP